MTWSSPTRGNQKHGLHVGSRQVLSFISAEPVATLKDRTMYAERRCWSLFAFQKFH